MIIGISGLIGSGKGTVADILVNDYGFQKASFADSLKDATASIFGWPRHLLEGDTEKSRQWREEPDLFWGIELREEITPRVVLQRIGTEAMRQGFFEGIWVSSLKRKLLDSENRDWVIPDTRFPNEIEMIQSIGGKVVKVRRGENPDWLKQFLSTNIPPENIHASEWAWTRSQFDTIIENDGTLDDLKEKIKNQILSRRYAFPKCH
jgi:hypothetical protein